MASILLTAFQPYDRWTSNSSWLTLVELTRQLPVDLQVTTRLYPVDYDAAREAVLADLRDNYDVALHLGQAPGINRIHLEALAINVRQQPGQPAIPLLSDGPLAYQSTLPLARWGSELVARGFPAAVSWHAGTYLCNALLYYSLHSAHVLGLKTAACFVHVPLDVSQIMTEPAGTPSLPVAYSAAAIHCLLGEIERGEY
ncbi:MAG: pyroglutamyl-peptidase I [Pirellulales bacterium]|nr:pyroglutamyl-peptidase I [Pirellulales bacterium]